LPPRDAGAVAAFVHGRAASLAIRGASVRGTTLGDGMATLADAMLSPVPQLTYPVVAELDAVPRR
jgi:hypothetical protein